MILLFSESFFMEMIFPYMLTKLRIFFYLDFVEVYGEFREHKLGYIFVNSGLNILPLKIIIKPMHNRLFNLSFSYVTSIIKIFSSLKNHMDNGENTNNILTQNTQPDSPRSSASRTSSSLRNSPMLQGILSSTQQIINSQAKKIFQLSSELSSYKKSYHKLENRYYSLMSSIEGKSEQKTQVEALLDTIYELQSELTNTKIELALVKETALEKHYKNLKESKQVKPVLKPGKNNIGDFFTIQKIKNNINFIKKQLNSKENESTKEIQELWDKYIKSHGSSSLQKGSKLKEKTNELVKKFIPQSMRPNVWPLIFENYLGITNSLYIQLLGRKEKTPFEKVKTQIGIQAFIKEKDIRRSFYGKTTFDSKIGLSEEVGEILQIFHCYRPDVSYVQGMTYPVIVLDLVVGKIKAFTIFSNIILTNKFFRRIFTFEGNFVSIYCRTFDVLLSEFYPAISLSLSKKKIQSQIYLIEWFYTFFSRGLSYELTLKIWDIFAYQQQLLFYRLGLSILELLEPKILKLQYEETIRLIRDYPQHIKEDDLLLFSFNHKLNFEKLEKATQKVAKQMKN